MPFFQNPFDQEFRGNLPLGDRQYSLTFTISGNQNSNQTMVAWNAEPYNFATYSNFCINFAIDPLKIIYNPINVNVAGVVPSATKAYEVVNLLNADTSFSGWFTASYIDSTGNGGPKTVLIRSKKPKQDIRVYIKNAGAEQILRFNAKAGVAELPTYYARDTIDNRLIYPDGNAILIQLDEGDSTVDQPIITAAGLDYSAMRADWQLLGGRSGIFNFTKTTLDGSGRVTESIQYPAGAAIGAFSKKTTYTYSGASTAPVTTCEVPYILASGDLITP